MIRRSQDLSLRHSSVSPSDTKVPGFNRHPRPSDLAPRGRARVPREEGRRYTKGAPVSSERNPHNGGHTTPAVPIGTSWRFVFLASLLTSDGSSDPPLANRSYAPNALEGVHCFTPLHCNRRAFERFTPANLQSLRTNKPISMLSRGPPEPLLRPQNRPSNYYFPRQLSAHNLVSSYLSYKMIGS